MLWFHLFTEIKQQRNNLFLWFPMAFAFGTAANFAPGDWIGSALFIILLICVWDIWVTMGVNDSTILPLLILLFVATLGAGAASLRSYAVWPPASSYLYYGEVWRHSHDWSFGQRIAAGDVKCIFDGPDIRTS